MSSAYYLLVSLPTSARAGTWISSELGSGSSKPRVRTLELPQFQSGTLDSLVQQSEDLAKSDTQLGQAVVKVDDVLSAVDGESLRRTYAAKQCECIDNFRWNAAKFHLDKPLVKLSETIVEEALQLDADVRQQFQQYQQHKSALAAAERKQHGDLTVRLLHDIVRPEQFVVGSENLASIAIAVPHQLISEFLKSYETVSPFVVPRSAIEVFADKDYSLYVVTTFKKYQSAFVTAAREHKWHPRTDFEYLDLLLQAMRDEYEALKSAEASLRTDTIRLARQASIDLCSLWMHLKTVRIYVELVLRYGLPPQFDYFTISFDNNQKACAKAKKDLLAKFAYLGEGSADTSGAKPNLKEYAGLMDTEYEPFVLYELKV